MINWVQLIASFIGSLGFAWMFNLKRKKAWWTAVGGFVAWFVYLLVGLVYPVYGVQFLLAGIVLGIYCEIMAVYIRIPRTAFIAVGIIPLIPGAALYHAMYYFFQKNADRTIDYALEAVVTSAAIVAGLLLAMMGWKVLKQVRLSSFQKKEKPQP